ncbi:hypothetical protein B0J13DRAFT_652303 [Dactylonectria estremocensis]|uniref:DUF1993 domain-containing protein n=1 Tax=Dactylonectria estremocensis TaxID=1079267 RepID=A0A9P9DFX5_9HYPO|nr:hypothetical protein B0J13DRAFT_652303 [Dactylonectria estremocensis]
MSYTFYNSSVILARDALNSLTAILKKAAEHPNADLLTSARLYEDMFPLSFQVFMVTDIAQKVVARTSGMESLSQEPDFETFEAMQARIEQALEIINKADKELINKRVEEIVQVGIGGDKTAEMQSCSYVNGYALPVAFFHLSMAYAILRKEGVPLGKTDYLESFLGQYLS